MPEGIASPQGHRHTYIYDSDKFNKPRFLLICHACEDGYSINFKQFELGPKRNMNLEQYFATE